MRRVSLGWRRRIEIPRELHVMMYSAYVYLSATLL